MDAASYFAHFIRNKKSVQKRKACFLFFHTNFV